MNRPLERTSFSNPYSQFDVDIPPVAFWSCTVGASILLAYLIHGLFTLLDYPILSISEILWNCFVWLMPSSLVLGLRPDISSPIDSNNTQRRFSSSSQHAAKSEVLRSVFKLDSRTKPSSSYLDAPPGLGNWDNSCYQNSVLQALASVRCLATFFEHLKQNIADLPEDTTVNSLDNFIQSLNNVSNSGRHLWTPHKLKSMSSWQQQDAQEYFSKLVDAIEKDTASGLKRKRASTQTETLDSIATILQPPNITSEKRNVGIVAEGPEKPPVPRGFEHLQNPLEGLLAQRVGCTQCGYSEGLSLIPFNCITLPLGRKWSYDIRDCFEEYTDLESIEGVECAKCSLMQMKHELRRQAENVASLSKEEEDISENVEAYKARLEERLEAITEALRNEDFSETTLARKCQIPSSHRVASTKSKQVTIMKPPQCLVMHINRSLFDEYSGAQLKNYADVLYKIVFDMSRWCVGNKVKVDLKDELSTTEEWEMDPTKSMIAKDEPFRPMLDCRYELRAIITHIGRHENGHYVCYRRLRRTRDKPQHENEDPDADCEENYDTWWRLSDENVSLVSEDEALSQGGAFMLFYERIEDVKINMNPDTPQVTEEFEEMVQRYATPKTIEVDGISAHVSTPALTTNVKGQDETNSPEQASVPLHSELAQGERENLDKASNASQFTSYSTPELVDAIESISLVDSAQGLPNRSLSPAMMRTAGMQKRSSQASDPFKAMAMVATT